MTTAENGEAPVVQEHAPAKINLTLHVTGQRVDGYHELDTLVVFADIGDTVYVRHSDDLRLSVIGPMAAGVPVDDSNLVLRAARAAGIAGADITLDKHLPSAAGIGGGSSDAAAVLRAFSRSHGSAPLPFLGLLDMGADVPMCLAPEAARVTGIGERIAPVPDLPSLPAVLVNPGVAVPTGGVFQRLTCKNGTAMADLPTSLDHASLVRWLAEQRNDLEAPAIACAPVIAEVLDALQQHGALIARMSGSGATCFGLFETLEAAKRAARVLYQAQPGFWIRATTLNNRVSTSA